MLDSNGIWTGIQLALFLPLLIITVMLFQIYQGAMIAGVGEANVGKGFKKHLRAAAGVATLGTIAVSLGVFVLLPRGGGAGALGNIVLSVERRQTAFTNSVTLGVKGIISDSPKIVLDLVVRDEAGQNMGGEDLVQYLRGAVLTEYERDSGKWSGESKRYSEGDLNPGDTPFPFGHPTGPEVEQTISLRGTSGQSGLTYLFALWRPDKISFGVRGHLWHDLDTHVLKARLEAGPFQYTVVSSLTDSVKEISEARGPTPPGSAPIENLARTILANADVEPDPDLRDRGDDQRAARLIQDYLRTQYEYTLEQDAPPQDVDPIEYFLLDRKKGNCEYFAAAMVLLCRSVGINARMVTGYIATEYNPTTGAYLVRESNAHAWVEAEDGEHHYKRFDPTPPDELARIHQVSTGILGRVRRALEALEYAWNSSVVSFDENARQRLLGPGRGEPEGLLARVDRVSSRVRAGGATLMLKATLAGLAVFAVVSAGGVVILRIYEAFRRKWRRSGGRPVIVDRGAAGSRQYVKLLKLLARRGVGKPSWRPPLEHAGVLAAVDGGLAGDVGGVVELYYKERFGGKRASE